MRKTWVAVLGFTGLVLAVGLVVFQGSPSRETSEARTAQAAPPSRAPGRPVPSAAPRPSGSLRIRGVVLDDRGPVAGVRVSASRVEPEQTLSELPCPPEVLARQRMPDLPDQRLLGCLELATARVAELVQAREGEAPVYAETTTAPDGAFVLDGLPPGAFTLWALDARGARMRTGVPAGTEDVELRLAEGLTGEGIVTGEDGRTPIPGAQVTLLHMEHTRFFDTRTGPEGRFRLGPLPAGSYATVVLADGWLPGVFPNHQFPTPETPLRLSRPRRLTGRVLSPGGAPAPGVEVHAVGSAGEQVTTADAEGRFTFTSLPPGEQVLSASRDGRHALARVALADTAPPEVVLTLGDALLTQGTVRDTEGQPIAGARVSVMADRPWHAVTGPDGRYAVGPLVPERDYDFSISAPRHLDAPYQRHRVAVGMGPLDFVLARAVSVEGIVRDTGGQPLAGIELKLIRTDEEGGDWLQGNSRSDEAGRFVLDAARPGADCIVIKDSRFLPVRFPVQTPSRDVQVVLSRGASVSVTVTDAHGLPLGGAGLALWSEAPPPGKGWSEATDGEGRGTLQGLGPGRYVLGATFQEEGLERRASRTLDLKENETAEVSLRFEDGRMLSGVVVDNEGKPVAGAHVRAEPSEATPSWRRQCESCGPGPGASGGVRTGPDGRFTLRNLATEAYRLLAEKAGYTFAPERAPGGTAQTRGVLVDARAQDVRLVLERLGRIRGRLVTREGAPVTTFTANGWAATSPYGTFEIPFEESGEAELTLAAPGLAPLRRTVTVREGIDVDVGTLTMEPGRQLRGRVVDAETSKPVATARVTLFRAAEASPEPAEEAEDASDFGPAPEATVETAADGTFVLPDLPRQPLLLDVAMRDYVDGRVALDATAEEVTVPLDPGARVEVTVRDAQGRPLAADLSFRADWGMKDVDVPATGTAVVRGLPPGLYTVLVEVTAEPPLPVFLPQRVEVPARGRVPLTLEPRTQGATVVVRTPPPAESLLLLPGEVPMPARLGDLMALSDNQHPSDGSATSGREVTFRQVPPGRFTLFVVASKSGEHRKFSAHREVLDVPTEGTVTRNVVPAWRPLPL